MVQNLKRRGVEDCDAGMACLRHKSTASHDGDVARVGSDGQVAQHIKSSACSRDDHDLTRRTRDPCPRVLLIPRKPIGAATNADFSEGCEGFVKEHQLTIGARKPGLVSHGERALWTCRKPTGGRPHKPLVAMLNAINAFTVSIDDCEPCTIACDCDSSATHRRRSR